MAPAPAPRRRPRTPMLLALTVAARVSAIAVNTADQQLLFPWREGRQAQVARDRSSAGGPQSVSLIEEGTVSAPGPAQGSAAVSGAAQGSAVNAADVAAERRQILEDMGHLEDRFESVQARQAALRGQLLEEAARLQAAEQTVAKARRAALLAESRARRAEAFLAVLLAGAAGAAAWLALRRAPKAGADAGAGAAAGVDEGAGGEAVAEAAAVAAPVAVADCVEAGVPEPPVRVTAPRVWDRRCEYYNLADEAEDDGGSGAAPQRRWRHNDPGATASTPSSAAGGAAELPEGEEEGDPI